MGHRLSAPRLSVFRERCWRTTPSAAPSPRRLVCASTFGVRWSRVRGTLDSNRARRSRSWDRPRCRGRTPGHVSTSPWRAKRLHRLSREGLRRSSLDETRGAGSQTGHDFRRNHSMRAPHRLRFRLRSAGTAITRMGRRPAACRCWFKRVSIGHPSLRTWAIPTWTHGCIPYQSGLWAGPYQVTDFSVAPRSSARVLLASPMSRALALLLLPLLLIQAGEV